MLAGGCLEAETLDVRIVLLVGIVEYGGPYFVRIVFLQYAYAIVIVIVQVEVGGIELSAVLYDKDGVFALEFSEIFSATVVVEAQHVTVEPDFPSAQGGASALFQGYLVYGEFREYISHGLPSLDIDVAEILLEDNTAYTGIGFQGYLDDFSFSIGIGGEVGDTGVGSTLRHIVFAVTHHGSDGKTLDIACPLLAVTVADIVDGTFVVLLKNVGIKYILAHELLVGHRCDDIFSIAEEDNHVIYGRAVAYEFVFLQSSSDEPLFAVDVQLFVGFDDFGCFDGVEVTQFRAAGEGFAVLVLQHTEPVDGIFHDVCQMAVYLLYVLSHACYQFLCLVGVEFEDTCHLYLHQPEDVFLGHFADKSRVVGSQALIDMFAGGIHVFGLFKLLILVNTFFNEYLFE